MCSFFRLVFSILAAKRKRRRDNFLALKMCICNKCVWLLLFSWFSFFSHIRQSKVNAPKRKAMLIYTRWAFIMETRATRWLIQFYNYVISQRAVSLEVAVFCNAKWHWRKLFVPVFKQSTCSLHYSHGSNKSLKWKTSSSERSLCFSFIHY